MAKKKQAELTIEEKLQNALVPKEEQPYKIPNNWCWTRWGNLSDKIQYGVNTPATNEGNARLVRISDIQNNKIIWDKVPYCNIDDKLIEQYLIRENDILFARTGGTVGKSVMAIGVIPNAVFAGYLIRSNYSKKLNGKYLKYFMESNLYWTQLKIGTTATAQPNCNGKTLAKMIFPLSPIDEQQRIVNRIESLFTKLDKAKELIENTLVQFEQNKMAILHKAFTGELTAKWRKENNLTLDSWENICLGKGLFPMKTRKPSGKTFRYIDIDAIDNKKQIVKEPKVILTEKAPSRASRAVENDDVLFSMVRPYLKNIALIDEKLSDCIASTGFYVCKCKPNLNAKFLYYLLCFDKTIDYLMQFMKGDNSPSIRKDDLLDMEIKLPTIEEQQEIVNIIDRIFIKYDKIKDLQAQIDKIELLKKSILAKAFRGELGTNDPNEESAEVLLRKILAEK